MSKNSFHTDSEMLRISHVWGVTKAHNIGCQRSFLVDKWEFSITYSFCQPAYMLVVGCLLTVLWAEVS